MRTLLKLFCLCPFLAASLTAQPQALDIYWIDVDGGAATLIVTPSGESVLIDAGENDDRHAARIYDVATKVAGLKQIDHFVVTHFHSDHFGGTYKLSRLIPLKNIYDHGIVPNPVGVDRSYKELMPLYQKVTRGHSRNVKAGDSLKLKQSPGLPPVVMQCVASFGKIASTDKASSSPTPLCGKKQSAPHRPEFNQYHGENAASIVFLLKYGQFSFLGTGDLTWDVEEQLVCPVNLIGPVDLFQVSHHGLDASNNPVFIHSIRPRVVVINNAPEKGAEPTTMKTLQTSPGLETIWQMYRNVRTGPELNTDRQFIANDGTRGGGEFIKASAQPNGDFSVQIGLSGTRKEYLPSDQSRECAVKHLP